MDPRSDVFSEVKKSALAFFAEVRGSHDFSHTERVMALCARIGKRENADLEVLRYAALLHDIGRPEQDRSAGNVCHAEKGAALAENILTAQKMSADFITHVTACVATHRFRGGKPPKSLEARILYDADKLDSIGAVGVARTYLFAGEVGAKLHNSDVDHIEETAPYSEDDTGYREFMIKLRFVKSKLLTRAGRRIARGRHAFMTHFFRRMELEIKGKD